MEMLGFFSADVKEGAAAVREKRLSFRSLHDQDKVPLKQKLFCPADGKEIHAEHIGWAYAPRLTCQHDRDEAPTGTPCGGGDGRPGAITPSITPRCCVRYFAKPAD